MAFLITDSNPAYRVLPLLAVDAVTGLPVATAITKANVWIHKYGGSWVNPTNDPVAVAGQTGAWELPLTQPEIDTLGPLGWYLSGTGIRTEVSWEDVVAQAPKPDYYQNEASPSARVLPVVVIDDTSSDVSAALIDHTNIQLHKYGGSWVNATNDPVADAGKTGAWELPLTPAELDTDGPMAWRLVDVAGNVRTQVGWVLVAAASASAAVAPSPVSAVPSPIPTNASSYVDHVKVALARLPMQFKSS